MEPDLSFFVSYLQKGSHEMYNFLNFKIRNTLASISQKIVWTFAELSSFYQLEHFNRQNFECGSGSPEILLNVNPGRTEYKIK